MITPFEVAISESVLSDLRQRLLNTRWPEDFGNDSWQYGSNTQFIRELTEYWSSTYNWRERERMINRFAHFKTTLDDIPIHFIHEPGHGPRPIPLILSHGWPWTFWDFHKIIGPLSNPAAYGGNPEDAFDVVVPSLPGYGFSTPLQKTGINWWKTADLWVALMERLGFKRFGAHGGDWGSFISAQLGHKYAEQTIGVHIHTPAPLDFLTGAGWNPEDYEADEKHLLEEMAVFSGSETGYMALQTTKPQTLAVGLHDSPAGLLAWIVEKRRRWSDCGGDVLRSFSRDELIDTIVLYWVTESYHTSARFYREGAADPWRPSHSRLPVVEAPTALALFPGELTKPSRAWSNRYYNLQRQTPMPSGGHFAAMEAPEALVDDLRAFFRPLRKQKK